MKNSRQTILQGHPLLQYMKKLFTIPCFLLVIVPAVFSQDEVVVDSLQADSLKEISEITKPEKAKKSGALGNFFKKDYPNPKKALFMSLVIPGAGQIYNKKYWKVPIVWGGYGLMIYFIDFSGSQYRLLRQEYIYAIDGDENTVSQLMLYNGWGEDDILQFRDLYRKRLELSYIGLVAMVVLSGVDAFVDAHLMKFDVSEDLSMQLRPKVEILPNHHNTFGLGLSFQFNKKNNEPPAGFFQY